MKKGSPDPWGWPKGAPPPHSSLGSLPEAPLRQARREKLVPLQAQPCGWTVEGRTLKAPGLLLGMGGGGGSRLGSDWPRALGSSWPFLASVLPFAHWGFSAHQLHHRLGDRAEQRATTSCSWAGLCIRDSLGPCQQASFRVGLCASPLASDGLPGLQ